MKNPTPQQSLDQQELLDALYIRDGRDQPDHPFYHVYTGLGIKYQHEFDDLHACWDKEEKWLEDQLKQEATNG